MFIVFKKIILKSNIIIHIIIYTNFTYIIIYILTNYNL